MKTKTETINCINKTADEIDLEIIGEKFLAAALGYDELKIDFIYPPVRMVTVRGTIAL